MTAAAPTSGAASAAPQNTADLLADAARRKDEAERFLTLLDEDSEVFCFQTFDDDKERVASRKERARKTGRKDQDPFACTLHGTLDQLWPKLEEMNIQGAGVYVTVNAVAEGKPRLASNIVRTRAVFADFDPPETSPAPERYPLPPAWEVETSPGKCHTYWPVEGLPTDEFTAIQAAIIATLGSDPAPKDLNRVMRLPGFRHMKHRAQPFMVRLVNVEQRLPYPAEEIRRAFPPIEQAKRTSAKASNTPANDDYSTESFFAQVNRKAMQRLSDWVPALFPAAREYHDGFRVDSVSLGRGLEEDISLVSDGIKDFGTDKTHSPIDVVVSWGPARDIKEAAHWLCEQMGVNPSDLGWSEPSRREGPPPADLSEYPDVRTGKPASGSGGAANSTTDAWDPPRPLPSQGDMDESYPFPLDEIPAPSITRAVREVARFNKVHIASPALVGFGTLATAIGRRASVVEREGLSHFCSIFFAGIAEVSERKTPVFRQMQAPLDDWCAAQEQQWEEASRKARSRNGAIDAQVKRTKNDKDLSLEEMERKIDDLESQRLTVPPRPKLFTSDATEERLFQLMHDHGGAFAVMSGEGRPVIDAIMGKYSGEKRTGDALYLAGISGDTISRDRVGSADNGGPEDRIIRRPCLNVCIMVQPAKWIEMATHQALRSSGALARIWPAWLPSMAGKQHEEHGEAGLRPGDMEAYHDLVRKILDHNPPADEQGRPKPHVVRLNAEAAEGRRLYHNSIQDLMREGAEFSDVRDIAAKAVSQTVKLAMLFHLAQHPEYLGEPESTLTVETWAAAESVGRWFLHEAVRVQRSATDNPAMEHARRVLRWLDRSERDRLTTTILMQEGPRPRPKATEAEAVLDLLEDYGWIRRAPKSLQLRKPVYQVHPDLISQFSHISRSQGEK